MRINLVSQYYPPEIGAPQARLSEMSATWAKYGNEVNVYTAIPNHPTGIVPEEYKGVWFRKEQLNGVNVYRHGIYVTRNKGFFKKILSHLSFMLTVFTFSVFRGKKPSVYIVSSPTFLVVISTWLMSTIRGVPFIFEVRDLWPGIFVELGVLKNKTIIRFLESVEMFLYRKSKAVVVVSHGFKENIQKRGVSPDKIYVVTNGVDLTKFNNPEEKRVKQLRSRYGFHEKDTVILYIGAHGISQNLISIIHAANRTKHIKNLKYLFVGEGADKEKIMEESKKLNLNNVLFHDGVPREEVSIHYLMADICLVPLKNIEGFKTFIPSKMFEIMASSCPIVGSVSGESAQILNDSKGALVVEPDNVEQISEAITKLHEHPQRRLELGRNGYSFVESKFNREVLAESYLSIIKSIADD